jgi:hypothetical protein
LVTLVVPFASFGSDTRLVVNGIGCVSVTVRFSIFGGAGDGAAACVVAAGDGAAADGDSPTWPVSAASTADLGCGVEHPVATAIASAHTITAAAFRITSL